ncbi:3-keto-disaccharide hydrolase [Croceiramulus getboli]|nr:DUF1080 domain-containing protein [Flavobacteriaceae bacterium YJPT1-3]
MRLLSLFSVITLVIATSCKEQANNEATEETSMDTVATMPEPQEVKVLFDGENLEHWKAYNLDSIQLWSVEEGNLVFTPQQGRKENLITKDRFTNFELNLEWKISEGGNSGIMWGVQERDDLREPYLTGPEIQVLDNERHPDANVGGKTHQAGALYDMIEPAQDVAKPAGEWNKVMIRIDHEANKGVVELNGTQIVEFPVHGPEWEAMVADSKFADWKDFGKYRSGHIALQDHDDKVWYRNITIREL